MSYNLEWGGLGQPWSCTKTSLNNCPITSTDKMLAEIVDWGVLIPVHQQQEKGSKYSIFGALSFNDNGKNKNHEKITKIIKQTASCHHIFATFNEWCSFVPSNASIYWSAQEKATLEANLDIVGGFIWWLEGLKIL